MASAFASAIAGLFEDPNIGRAATYIVDGATPKLVRVITRRADDITNFGEARLWSETTRIDVLAAEISNPRPGDTLVLDGAAHVIEGEPVRDRERLTWTLTLRAP